MADMRITNYQRAVLTALSSINRTIEQNGEDATYETYMADLAQEATAELPGGAERAEQAASLLSWWDSLTDKERRLTGVGVHNF